MSSNSNGVVLALDNSLDFLNIALSREGCLLEERRMKAERHSSEVLSLKVSQVLSDQGLSPGDLSNLVVTLGPGSFTGVRVALAFCKGLSAGLEIPLLGLPTPDALAAPFVFLKDRYLCPLIDAKKGEVFFAFYRTAGGEVSRVSEIRSSTPEDLVTRVPPSCVCFGTGVPLCRKSFEVIGGLLMVERGFAQVSGEVLLKEGLARYEKGQPTSTEPIYGRRSEAEIKLKLEVS